MLYLNLDVPLCSLADIQSTSIITLEIKLFFILLEVLSVLRFSRESVWE